VDIYRAPEVVETVRPKGIEELAIQCSNHSFITNTVQPHHEVSSIPPVSSSLDNSSAHCGLWPTLEAKEDKKKIFRFFLLFLTKKDRATAKRQHSSGGARVDVVIVAFQAIAAFRE